MCIPYTSLVTIMNFSGIPHQKEPLSHMLVLIEIVFMEVIIKAALENT